MRKAVAALTGMFLVPSCMTLQNSALYTYSAAVWPVASADQPLVTCDGYTDQPGGYMGHYFGEPVQVGVYSIPPESVVIGSFWIASRTAKKCLPIRKWSKDGKIVYAIADVQAADKLAAVFLETESSILTESLLKELIRKFVPDPPADQSAEATGVRERRSASQYGKHK